MTVITLVMVAVALACIFLAVRQMSAPADTPGRGVKIVLLLVATVVALVFGGANTIKLHRKSQAKKYLEHGRELVQQGEMGPAEAEFRRADELDPDNEEIDKELADVEEAQRIAKERQGQGQGQVSDAGGGGGSGAPAPPQGSPSSPPIRRNHPQRVESQITIVDYELDADLDLDRASIKGRARLLIRSKEKKLKRFQISLSPKCTIDTITVDGQPAEAKRTDDWIEVTPKDNVTAEKDHKLLVVYEGFGDETLLRAEGSDEGQRRPTGMLPGGDILSREGSYLRPESRWYPAIGFLEFRSPVTVRLTVPDGQVAVGPGREGDVTDAPSGGKTYEWVSNRIVGGIAVATGQWKRLDGEEAGVPVMVLLWEKHADQAQKVMADTKAAMRYQTELFGKFPYEKYLVAEVPVFPGGYSPASLTFIGESVFEDQKLVDRILPHEVAHQWWGNLMLPQGAGAGWLAEGFAEYAHILYLGHANGDEAFSRAIWDAKQQYHLLQANPPEEPIAETDPFDQQGSYIGVVYSKGACVLHMLRHVMGEEAFFATLEEFVQQHKFGVAIISEFRDLAEEHHGQPLDWFFDQWLDRTGMIELSYNWETAQADDGSWETTVTLDQLTEEPYRMPIDFQLVTQTGKPVGTEELSQKHHVFVFITNRPPRDVNIDPDDKLLMAVPKIYTPPEPTESAN